MRRYLKHLPLALFTAFTVMLTLFIGAQIAAVSVEDRYELSAVFDDATGVRGGDPVRIAGVEVGRVRAVQAVTVAEGDALVGRAKVTFTVNSTVSVPTDTLVAIRWLNLLGLRTIELVPGSADEMLRDGDAATRTRSVVDLTALINQLGPFAAQFDPDLINQLNTELIAVLEGNTGNFAAIISDFDKIMNTLAERDDTIAQLITDYGTINATLASRDAQVQAMVDNLVLLTETFAASEGLLDEALVEVAGLSEEAAAFLREHSGTIGSIITNTLAFTEVTTNRLDDLETALAALPEGVEGLFRTTRRGEFINVRGTCVASQRPPCPEGSSGPSSATAGAGPLASPDAFARFLLGSIAP